MLELKSVNSHQEFQEAHSEYMHKACSLHLYPI